MNNESIIDEVEKVAISSIVLNHFEKLKDHQNRIKFKFNIEDVIEIVNDIYIKAATQFEIPKNVFVEIIVKLYQFAFNNFTSREYQRKRVKYIKQHLDTMKQRTLEWYDAREGRITTSSWSNAMGEYCDYLHDFNPKEAEEKYIQYIIDKVDGSTFTGNIATRWGTKYEEVANMIYEADNNVKVIEFGLICHEKHSFLASSPDGITPDGVMLEIKCPYRRKITGIPPHKYWVQVQGQLETCDLDRCDFLECQIEEYRGETKLDDYFEDNYENNYTLSCIGKYKGIVADLKCILRRKNKDDKRTEEERTEYRYNYSKLGLKRDEFEHFRQETMAMKEKISQENQKYSVIWVNFIPWKLIKKSCISIYRDRRWFNEHALPLLRDFWNKVEHYRKIGTKELRDRLYPNDKKVSIRRYAQKQRDEGFTESVFVMNNDSDWTTSKSDENDENDDNEDRKLPNTQKTDVVNNRRPRITHGFNQSVFA